MADRVDEYFKTFKVKIDADTSSVEKELKKQESRFEKFRDSFSEELTSKWKVTANDLGSSLASALNNGLDKVADRFVEVMKDAWIEIGNIAQFGTLANEQTRELAFKYGFNSAQAYGFSQAQALTGLSEEDLIYANAEERKRFQDAMTKYSNKYAELYDSGFFEDYKQFQYEMEDLKQELLMEVVQFFMDNKEEIKDGLLAIVKLSEFGIKALSKIVSFLGGNVATGSDIISNYSTSSKNVNVAIDNTFNNVASEDRGWLANAGAQTYEQIIAALK